jgi:hypothetical protein
LRGASTKSSPILDFGMQKNPRLILTGNTLTSLISALNLW